MPSTVIHLAIAKEINSKLKRDNSKFLLGAIAPDIYKDVGIEKKITHFIDNENGIPNLDLFLKKYKDNLDDDFVLGYYVHLFADFLWFKYFLTEIRGKNIITKIDGTKIKYTGNMDLIYIYSDYTDLNMKVIDKYSLDLKIYYNDIPIIDNIITEIPMDKLNILLDNTGQIIENSKSHKNMVFNMDHINQFIKTTIELLDGNLKEIGII